MTQQENRPHTGERPSIPDASYHDPRPPVTWADLQRIERAALPLLLLIGGPDDDRDDLPPQALALATLRALWAVLRDVANRRRDHDPS